MNLSARRIALLAGAMGPFIFLALGLAWSTGPLARVGARWCHLVLAPLSFGVDSGNAKAPSEGITAIESPSPPAASPPFRAPPAKRAASARRARPTVFVGPDSIQRAIPVAGRPTSSWTNRTPQHPAGLLIQSPGALAGVIESGDILVEAEGQPLGSFEQLLVTVRQAYEHRAKRLSGRLFRKGDLVPVTVEPGW